MNEVGVTVRTIFFICVLLSALVTMGEDLIGEDFRNGVVESTGAREEAPVNSRLAPENVPVPTPRPTAGVSVTRPRPANTVLRGGQPAADFSGVSRSLSSAPIWAGFAAVFSKCAPGCSPVRLGTWRRIPHGGRATSCHHLGKAVDLGGMKCGGNTFSAYTSRFKEFVDCVKTQSYNGKRWRTLFRQTHSGRNNCNSSNRDQTACHWDHVHISVGCSVRGT